MRRRSIRLIIPLALVVLLTTLATGVSAGGTSVIDFEGLTPGAVVSSVSSGSGISGDAVAGSVAVFGDSANPAIPTNAAVVFDSTCTGGCTGGDNDLFQPAHGNTLIIAEDLVDTSPADGIIDDPDDADLVGATYGFDFSGWGGGVVTVESIDVLDVESVEKSGARIEVYSGGPGGTLEKTVDIPTIGDGNVATVAVDASGIDFMKVTLNGSGAIDNIRILDELPPFARITGGGWRVTSDDGSTVRSSQGLTLHCDITLSNNLQINWQNGGSNKWHIDKVVDAAFCKDNPDFTPEPPPAPADTYIGLDVGRLNDVDGSVACFILEDHGEVANDPDGPDRALLRVWVPGYDPGITPDDLDDEGFDCLASTDDPSSDPNTALFVPMSAVNGNLQFHFDQPHK